MKIMIFRTFRSFFLSFFWRGANTREIRGIERTEVVSERMQANAENQATENSLKRVLLKISLSLLSFKGSTAAAAAAVWKRAARGFEQRREREQGKHGGATLRALPLPCTLTPEPKISLVDRGDEGRGRKSLLSLTT